MTVNKKWNFEIFEKLVIDLEKFLTNIWVPKEVETRFFRSAVLVYSRIMPETGLTPTQITLLNPQSLMKNRTFLSSSSSDNFCIFSYFLCSVLHLRKKLTSFSFNQSSLTIASSTKVAGVIQKSDRPILFSVFQAFLCFRILMY